MADLTAADARQDPVPGKVFLTVMERKLGMTSRSESRYRVIEADPWELVEEGGGGYHEIPFIVSG